MNLTPLWLSLQVAAVSTLLVFIGAVLFARLLSRRDFFGKSLVEAFFLLPLVLPPTVVGFGLLLLFSKNGLIGQWLLTYFHIQVVFTQIGAVIASAVVSFPLMYQASAGAFKSVDVKLEHAARTLGASEWKVFWTVTFPLAWTSILAGLLLTFARALGEFGATLMLAGYIPGKTDTMPLAIYFAVEAGQMDKALIWVIIIVALGLSTIFWLNWWSKRTRRSIDNRQP